MTQGIIKVTKEMLGGLRSGRKESWRWNEIVENKVKIKRECFKDRFRSENADICKIIMKLGKRPRRR